MPSAINNLEKIQHLIREIAEQNKISKEEALFIRDFLEEQSATIDILREDNLKLKEKLPQLQPLQNEFLNYKQETSEVIHTLNGKLTDMHLKVLKLEDKLTQLGLEIVHLETSKAKELDDLNLQWQEKLKEAGSYTDKAIQEIVKKHCEAKKNYEMMIMGFKEQIAHKEAEVAWCQLMVKEKDCNIDKELTNLKKELEVTTLKNQELLQQRLVEVERRANRMTQKCLRLQQGYEHKMSILKKEKDLEVQALKRQVMYQAERDVGNKSVLENAVKELELRYRKIIISLRTASQQDREQDIKRSGDLECLVTTDQNYSINEVMR